VFTVPNWQVSATDWDAVKWLEMQGGLTFNQGVPGSNPGAPTSIINGLVGDG
jgi:hypothetical protein